MDVNARVFRVWLGLAMEKEDHAHLPTMYSCLEDPPLHLAPVSKWGYKPVLYGITTMWQEPGIKHVLATSLYDVF